MYGLWWCTCMCGAPIAWPAASSNCGRSPFGASMLEAAEGVGALGPAALIPAPAPAPAAVDGFAEPPCDPPPPFAVALCAPPPRPGNPPPLKKVLPPRPPRVALLPRPAVILSANSRLTEFRKTGGRAQTRQAALSHSALSATTSSPMRLSQHSRHSLKVSTGGRKGDVRSWCSTVRYSLLIR